jgi:hypothetical protein
MILADKIDSKIAVFDIETLKELFDIGVYNPDTGIWTEFQISKWKNDLFKIVKLYTSSDFDYWVSFNGIGFDHQVLEYIVENYNDWYDLDNQQIVDKIYEFSQKVIDDQKYNLPPSYQEDDFQVKSIDLFRIHHFDNENRRTSLKWCAFMMDADVEEMPIHHTATGLVPSDVDIITSYRRNDVLVTYKLLEITLGITDLEHLKDYKGKNKIQDRFDIFHTTGMYCINWSDVKIGEEWNKLDYKISQGMENEKGLYPKNVVQPFGKPFSKYFPNTISYQTDELNYFKESFGKEFVKAQKQKFTFRMGETTYTIAKGGLHSNEGARRIVVPKGFILGDADVGSQYPKFIEKNSIAAPHLKEDIIFQFRKKIQTRIDNKKIANELKAQGKDDEARPYLSIQEMLKLCLNGGYYGKLNQRGSFLEYPEGYLRVSIGCQMEILMLIEMLELAGIKVISGNTDGVVSLYPEHLHETYRNVCKQWETIVGNTDLGKLEFVQFKSLWQESVNHYIALKVDGSVKKKGRFMTEYELNKNKSKRIIALATEAYFIHGTNPITFITSHKNIFDFCIAKKTFGNMHYEEIIEGEDRNKPTVIKHKKLIRYYVSTDGNVFMKRGFDVNGAPMNNHCEAIDSDFPWMGQPKLKYFNKYEKKEMSKYNINYSYYILETLKKIDKIEKSKKADAYADGFKTIQISMFS